MTSLTKNYRSDFATTRTLDIERVKQVAQAHGVTTLIDPATQDMAAWRRKKAREAEQLAAKGCAANHKYTLQRANLADGVPTDFEFKDWKPKKQQNDRLAFEIAKKVYFSRSN